jgi:Signal transduction histidine kinase
MRFKNFLLKSKLVICIVVGVFLVLVVSTAVIISTVTSQEEKLAYQKSIEMASSYANQFDVDNMIEAFRNGQHRVKSMALAHEKLYQSEDMVSVDFADYLKNLVDYLFQSYSLDSGKVSLKLDVEKVFGNGQGCSPRNNC